MAAKLIDDDGLTPQERVSIMDEKDFDNLRREDRGSSKSPSLLPSKSGTHPTLAWPVNQA